MTDIDAKERMRIANAIIGPEVDRAIERIQYKPARLSLRMSPGAPVMEPAAPTPEVSPTGTPMLPPKAVPYLVALVGLAAVGMQVLPEHTLASKACSAIVALGALLGVASPGLRKKA